MDGSAHDNATASTRPAPQPTALHQRLRMDAYPRRAGAHWIVRTGMVWPLLALWVGMGVGLAESVVQLVRRLIGGPAALGALQMNREAVWMITAADVLLVGVVGVALWPVMLLACRRWPGARRVGFALLLGIGLLSLILTQRGVTTLAAAILSLGLGATIARRVDPLGPACLRALRVTMPVFVLAGLGLFVGQRGYGVWHEQSQLGALPQARPGSPNILLIVLDTVRADAMSSYGYPRQTTPNLDELAGRGIRFEHAYAPGAWTLPSHASLFTGRWPHELSARIDQPLDRTHPTIAEFASSAGYQTAGFVANTYFCNAWYGLGRGFLHYADMAFSMRSLLGTSALGRRISREMKTGPNERPDAHFPRKSAAKINAEFLDWLDQRDPGHPVFAFLNYFDAHDPYLLLKEPVEPWGLRPRSKVDRAMLIDWHFGDKTRVTPRQVQMARDCYDDCLTELDSQVGELLSALRRRQLDRSTWIVLTSDHGEQFGDHDKFGHGSSLYRSVIHVPLLIVPPAGTTVAPAQIGTPVSLRDIPATLARWMQPADSKAPEPPFPGSTLEPYWTGGAAAVEPSDVFAELVEGSQVSQSDGRRPIAVVAEGHWYLRQGDGHEELYAMLVDPAQEHNLAGTESSVELMIRFREKLDRFERGDPADPLEPVRDSSP